MGLDTSHNAWHGSYTGFGEWRKWIAEQIGIKLDAMEGFKPSGKVITWKSLPHDDLHYLLHHSDCDGSITWNRCGKIAKRLKEVVKKVQKESKANKTILDENEWKLKATKCFTKGCQQAFDLKETLEFN